MNAQKSFGARFGLEAAQVVIDLVQARNKDKPKICLEWLESLVIDVLDCIANAALNAKPIATPKVSSSDVQSLNNFSFGNKFISIHSFILERNIETIVEKPSPQVQHPIPNLNEASTFVAGVISDGDFLNPVVLSSSSPVPKSVVNEANAEGAIPMDPLSCGKSASDAIGISPSTMQCPIPAIGSSLMHSAGPDKKCEPKVVVTDFQKPSFAEFSRSLGVQSHPKVFIQQHKVKEGDSSFGGLSPLVPIRLSQRFHNVDCIEMVTLPPSEVSKSNFSSSHLNDQKPVDDVQIVGTSSFVDRCKDLSRSNDVAYNKLNNFNLTESQSISHFPKNQKAIASSEVEILSSGNASRDLSPAQVPKAHGSSFVVPSGSSGAHPPRRMVLPGRYNSDSYVAQGNKFPVSAKERRHLLAMVQIGDHESWCKYEAIRYD
ncbi:uncharacterized protein LOC119307978 isoform X3 [Triticum dicoccoides]|uniref:uncharacterized protein LOC119307978 isoform X3 n=1 Tax=Triticum dicoccoides TaxID=85692 RepID=UPI000E7BD850|nr:uncharacterized protein LOC119307978 isoform X3 [Triticum dicoccoides]